MSSIGTSVLSQDVTPLQNKVFDRSRRNLLIVSALILVSYYPEVELKENLAFLPFEIKNISHLEEQLVTIIVLLFPTIQFKAAASQMGFKSLIEKSTTKLKENFLNDLTETSSIDAVFYQLTDAKGYDFILESEKSSDFTKHYLRPATYKINNEEKSQLKQIKYNKTSLKFKVFRFLASESGHSTEYLYPLLMANITLFITVIALLTTIFKALF